MSEMKLKTYKVVVKDVKYCTYIVDAKSEDDIWDNINPEIAGEHIYTNPKSNEIIHIEPKSYDDFGDDADSLLKLSLTPQAILSPNLKEKINNYLSKKENKWVKIN